MVKFIVYGCCCGERVVWWIKLEYKLIIFGGLKRKKRISLWCVKRFILVEI